MFQLAKLLNTSQHNQGILMIDTNKKKAVEKHILQAYKYLRNAYRSIEHENYEKASEFFWGATAQIIKAVASSKGHDLKSHAKIVNFAKEISKEQNDKGIYDAFFKAKSLHSNFYEISLEKFEVEEAGSDVVKMINKLLRLLGYEEFVTK